MRLLSATQVEDERKKKQETENLRVARLNEQVTSKIKELNRIEQEQKDKTVALGADFEAFSQRLAAKKSALVGEVSALERRKQEALQPINEQRREVNHLITLQREREQTLKSQEMEVEKTLARLKRIEDRLEDREYDISDKEMAISERFKTLDERDITLERNERAFSQRFTQSQKEFNEQQKEVVEKEKVLSAGMEWVKRREEALDAEKKALEFEREKLIAQEIRLGKHFKTLKAKGLL